MLWRRGDILRVRNQGASFRVWTPPRELPDVSVFHAGTTTSDGHIVTDGGRVLTVVGRGATFGEAIATAYRGVQAIAFDGMQYRRDIGRKALAVAV